MSDIAMCRDWECPLWRTCLRFLAQPDQRQSYFAESPRDGTDAYPCEHFSLLDASGIHAWQRYVEVRLVAAFPDWKVEVTPIRGEYLIALLRFEHDDGRRTAVGRRFAVSGLARAGAWRVKQFIEMTKRELEAGQVQERERNDETDD